MPNDEDRRRDVEIVLDPRQVALILDSTKGNVSAYVGPVKTSLASTDQPVRFDGERFVRCSVQDSIQSCPEAKEGSYIVLENPEKAGAHPNRGSSAVSAELLTGRKVNIPGPVSFPLWPGQRATVLPGHTLRSNQFLVAVVYNDDEANKNWGEMVMKPQDPAPALTAPKGGEGSKSDKGEGGEGTGAETPPEPVKQTVDEVKKQVGTLTMGKRIVIKGTEVSFFIPPTGVEVVPDEEGNFVRDAVTLETLECCILVEEKGDKRYVRGADVVFPEPTEDFIYHRTADGKKTRKFRAIELNEQCGIYVKVIADYEDGNEKFKEGDELFITGKEQRIYFPRAEHALVRYDGKGDRVFAITIPAGEARYVLDKRAETIKLVKGPKIFLPDPRHEVVVRRVLSDKDVGLMFPGNVEATSVNKVLAAASKVAETSGYVSSAFLASQSMPASKELGDQDVVRMMMRNSNAGFEEEAAAPHIADEVKRQTRYTPPRELVLDSKFDGAVLVDVWTGYAVQVRSKMGEREVVVGPQPRLLEYDETLDALDLSMGTPKSRKGGTLRTVYLRVANNRVSDKIVAETSDLVGVSLVVAYRVDFEGEPEQWFQVEDYVQLLTEHARSMIRNAVKQIGVQKFMADSVALVRDMILGKPNEKGERTGLLFKENGMVVKDVEVLDVTIGDKTIAKLLIDSQHAVVQQELTLAHRRRALALAKESEQIARETAAAEHETAMAAFELEQATNEGRANVAAEQLRKSAEVLALRETTGEAEEDIADMKDERRRDRAKASQQLEFGFKQAVQALDLETVKAGTEAIVEKIKAIGPDLVAALQVHGDQVFTAGVVKELGAVAALSGDSVEGVFKKLLTGSVIGDVFSGNGKGNAAGIAAAVASRTVAKKESGSRT